MEKEKEVRSGKNTRIQSTTTNSNAYKACPCGSPASPTWTTILHVTATPVYPSQVAKHGTTSQRIERTIPQKLDRPIIPKVDMQRMLPYHITTSMRSFTSTRQTSVKVTPHLSIDRSHDQSIIGSSKNHQTSEINRSQTYNRFERDEYTGDSENTAEKPECRLQKNVSELSRRSTNSLLVQVTMVMLIVTTSCFVSETFSHHNLHIRLRGD